MKADELVIPDSAVPFVRLQRSRYIERKVPDVAEVRRRYSAHVANDFAGMLPFLPAYSPDQTFRILEIGCGVGALNVFLQKHYGHAEVHLLDGNETTNAGGAGYSDKPDIYNSRAVTEELLAANGCKVDRWHDIGTKELLEADLIVSLASWGYHYPLSTYKTAGLHIVDLRRGVPENNAIRRREVVFVGPKYDRVRFTLPL